MLLAGIYQIFLKNKFYDLPMSTFYDLPISHHQIKFCNQHNTKHYFENHATPFGFRTAENLLINNQVSNGEDNNDLEDTCLFHNFVILFITYVLLIVYTSHKDFFVEKRYFFVLESFFGPPNNKISNNNKWTGRIVPR
jgi:hypothetical protein